jgi:hypothetical protein
VEVDASARECVSDLDEVLFVSRVERDCDGAGEEPRRRRLSGGVDGLRNLRPVGEVGADDDVVDGVTVLRATGVGVNGCCA